MSRYEKSVVFLLVVVLGLTTININGLQVTASNNEEVSITDDNSEESIIEAISQQEVINDESNSLNTITVDNNDGTNTIYIFNEDIRYIDENGKIVDKDLSLKSVEDKQKIGEGYIAEVKNNDIKTQYPISLDDKGIVVEEIELIPCNTKATISTSDSSAIYYDDVYENLDMVCSPKYQGLYVEMNADNLETINTVEFKINIENSCNIYSENRNVIIEKNDRKYEIVGSEIKNTEGIVIGHSYFTLQDTNTIAMQYDLYEDAISADNILTGFSAVVSNEYITDTTYFEEYTYGDAGYNFIGSDVEHGVSRALVKFDLSALDSISYDKILSASYNTYLYNTGTGTDIGEVYVVTGAGDYSADTIDYMPSYKANYKVFSFNSKDAFNRSGYKDIYITSVVQAWLQGLYNNGIMLKCKNDEGWIEFASASNTIYQPYLSVTYSVNSDTPVTKGIVKGDYYYILNKDSRKSLFLDDSADVKNVVQDDFAMDIYEEWFLLHDSTENGTEYYRIKNSTYNYFLEVAFDTENNSSDIYAGLYSDSDTQKWKIVRSWDGSYKLTPKMDETKALAFEDNSSEAILVTASVDFDKSDDWTFLPVYKSNATIYGSCGWCQDINSLEEITNVQNLLTENDFTCYNMHNCEVDLEDGEDMASKCLTRLFNSDVWYFSTHGGESRMIFCNSRNDKTESRIGPSTTTELQDEEEESNQITNPLVNVYGVSDYVGDLNSLQLAIMNSCLTGASNDNENLLGTMYEEGAKCLVAHTETVLYNEYQEWQKYFNLALSISDVEAALEFADRVMNTNSGNSNGQTNTNHVLGDTSYFYNYDIFAKSEEEMLLVNNSDKVININGEDIDLVKLDDNTTLTNEVSQYSTATDVDYNDIEFYTDDEGNIYGYSKETGKLLMYNYNHKLNSMGSSSVTPLDAFTCARNFLNDLGHNITHYSGTYSNEYSTEYILKYSMSDAEVGEISNIYVYVENDKNGEQHVTFYMAQYKN